MNKWQLVTQNCLTGHRIPSYDKIDKIFNGKAAENSLLEFILYGCYLDQVSKEISELHGTK